MEQRKIRQTLIRVKKLKKVLESKLNEGEADDTKYYVNDYKNLRIFCISGKNGDICFMINKFNDISHGIITVLTGKEATSNIEDKYEISKEDFTHKFKDLSRNLYSNISYVNHITKDLDYNEKMYKVHYSDMMKKADEFRRKYPRLPIDDNHDELSADAFFQFCAFNEIIFG